MATDNKNLTFATFSECGKITDYWNVVESGSWSEDNRIGREHAQSCIEHMKDTEDPVMLGKIVQSMIVKGRYAGPEVGFFNHIAAAL